MYQKIVNEVCPQEVQKTVIGVLDEREIGIFNSPRGQVMIKISQGKILDRLNHFIADAPDVSILTDRDEFFAYLEKSRI